MPLYSPERRTAVILSGSGVHGAYHAGVLRALHEAGVKIDLMAGHGAGAANAAVAAVDGQARLWEPDGLWLGREAASYFGWTTALRAAGWLLVALASVLLLPLVLLVGGGLLVYTIAFLLDTVGAPMGDGLARAFSDLLQRVTAAEALPSLVPRLAVMALAALVVVLTAGSGLARWRGRGGRSQGAPWWRVLGAPIRADGVQRAFSGLVWQLLRGAGTAADPSPEQLGARYADVLSESVGQPGFRELVVAVTDLDSRRDVVGAVLTEPRAHEFFMAPADADRRAGLLNLGGADREVATALVSAALTPPVGADPTSVRFAADGHWRGEAHRLCDRPGILHRLCEEVALAGATQVVLVSAVADIAGPHRLPPARLDVRHRIGELLVAAESAALRDVLVTARLRFDHVYVVRPAYNPLGPFDSTGVYDRASDRRVDVAELVRMGHDDAVHQFIEPVVGASGDRLDDPIARRRGLAERVIGH
jgi:hypothetical protein